jgi:hypothetical protein
MRERHLPRLCPSGDARAVARARAARHRLAGEGGSWAAQGSRHAQVAGAR